MTAAHTNDRERFHQAIAADAPEWSEFAGEAAALVDRVNTGLRLAADRSTPAGRRAANVSVAKAALNALEVGIAAADGRFSFTGLERVREQLDHFDHVLCGRPTLVLQ